MAKSNERRVEPRTPIELKVEYKRLNTFFYDYTKNISKGGTFIKTTKPLPPGTLFVFKLVVPSLADPLVLHGEVRWLVRPGEESPEPGEQKSAEPGMGIRFVYEDEKRRADVDQTVERLMIESLGPVIYAKLRTFDR